MRWNIGLWDAWLLLSAQSISLVIQVKRLVILNILETEELLHGLTRAKILNALFKFLSLLLVVVDYGVKLLGTLTLQSFFCFVLLFHFHHLSCLKKFWRCSHDDSILRQIFQCQDTILNTVYWNCLRFEWLEELLTHPSLGGHCLFRVSSLPKGTSYSLWMGNTRLTCIYWIVNLISRSLCIIVEVSWVFASQLTRAYNNFCLWFLLNKFQIFTFYLNEVTAMVS